MTGQAPTWDGSAEAWLREQGRDGDWARRYVLDRVMLERVRAGPAASVLDVGCGEGRFCRMLAGDGIFAIGIDPTARLLAEAWARDPQGDYRSGRAEALAFDDGAFDLVVSYLTLIDIQAFEQAIAEMARVCAPGGRILIANLASFNTAGQPRGWVEGADGVTRFAIDAYQTARAIRAQWNGIDIINWHRPLAAYMQAFLAHGLRLSHFDEPSPTGYPPENREKAERYRRVPYFVVMEWLKDGGTDV